MSILQLYILLLIIFFLLFVIVYALQKRYKKTRDLIWESFSDGITLNSGVIVLLYVTGKIFQINYLSLIDDYALYVGLLIAGLVIVGGSIDKLKKKRRLSKYVKTK